MPSIVGGNYFRDQNELREHRELRGASAEFRDHEQATVMRIAQIVPLAESVPPERYSGTEWSRHVSSPS
jgi:hypothetical protein